MTRRCGFEAGSSLETAPVGSPCIAVSLAVIATARASDHDPGPEPDGRPRSAATRLRWSAVLERVFGSEVTTCPQCGDRLELLAFLTDADVTAPILALLGLATTAPALAPARAPPDLTFDDLAGP